METIEERATDYASKCPGCQNTEWGFIAGAEWMREELTRWPLGDISANRP